MDVLLTPYGFGNFSYDLVALRRWGDGSFLAFSSLLSLASGGVTAGAFCSCFFWLSLACLAQCFCRSLKALVLDMTQCCHKDTNQDLAAANLPLITWRRHSKRICT